MPTKLILLGNALLLGSTSLLSAQDVTRQKSQEISSVLLDAGLWSLSMEKLESKYRVEPTDDDKRMEEFRRKSIESRGGDAGDPYYGGFAWLSDKKDGLRAEAGRLKLFEQKIGEVVVKGEGGSVGAWSISLFNRGDDGDKAPRALHAEFEKWKTLLDEKIGVAGQEHKSKAAVKLEAYIWKKGDSAWLLESSTSEDATGYSRAEFMRIRIASISVAGNTKIAGRTSLKANVTKKDDGDVYIQNIPMVDQGQKGYCAVATIARVTGYYGLDVDQHEMAQLANASEFGTSPEEMEEAFKKIVGKLHIRTTQHFELTDRQFDADVRAYNQLAKKDYPKARTFKLEKNQVFIPEGVWSLMDPEVFVKVKAEQSGCKRFSGKVAEYIDQGIPLCWCLRLGMFKEPSIPQTRGGHMRLIIGYNPKTDEVVYTDSWGKGHEYKKMPMAQAYACSMAVYNMSPTR